MEGIFDFVCSLCRDMTGPAVNGLIVGIIITSISWLLWFFMQRTNATTRYVAWWTTMALVLLLPVLLGLELGNLIDDSSAVPISKDIKPTIENQRTALTDTKLSEQSIPATGSAVAANESKLIQRPVGKPNQGQPTITPSQTDVTSLLVGLLPVLFVGAWLLISTNLLWRLFKAHSRMVLIKENSVPFDFSNFKELHRRLESVIGKRKLKICMSSEVSLPVAAGLGNPMVLLPDDYVGQLTESELEAVILHEIAHIKRWDDWSRLGQMVIKAVAFFNPAVYWISNQLELERELACDEFVLQEIDRPNEYARCLTRVLQLSNNTTSLLVPGVLTGRKQIFKRFDRILSGTRPLNARFSLSRYAGIVTALIVGTIVAIQVAPAVAVPIEQVTFAELTETVQSIWKENESEEVSPVDDISDESVAQLEDESITGGDEKASETEPVQEKTDGDEIDNKNAWEVHDAVIIVDDSDEDEGAASESAATVTSASASFSAAQSYYASALAASSDRRSSNRGPLGRIVDWAEELLEGFSRGTCIRHGDFGETSITWSDGRTQLSVKSKGIIELTDDDRSIKSISGGGYLALREKRRSSLTELDIEPSRDGRLEYDYYVNERSRDFDDEAQKWLAEILIDFVHFTAIGAEQRVARFFEAGGVDAVLNEIAQLESDYVKGVYYELLMDTEQLNSIDYSLLLRQMGQDFDSDYEKAELLISMLDYMRLDDELTRDYVDVVRSIDSDYETRRILSAISIDEETDQDIIATVLEIASTMDSDYEKAELLIDIARVCRTDEGLQESYVKAVADIDSDYEKKRVLSALSLRRNTDPAIIIFALGIANDMDSDYEKAELLIDLSRQCENDAALRDAYINAIHGIDSDYETRRVLSALGSKRDLDTETVGELLELTAEITSDYEKAELLIELSELCEDDPTLRATMINAATSLDSDYEKKRVLGSIPYDCETDSEAAIAVLKAAELMSSDYEKTELLMAWAECAGRNTDVRQAYLNATTRIDSDYEKKRALQELISESRLNDQLVLELLEASVSISSDYEKSEVLKKLARYCRGNDDLEDAYLDVVDTIDSDYEIEQLYKKIGRKYHGKDTQRW